MGHMDVQNLSSNWKQLQAKLQTSLPSTTSKKRPADSVERTNRKSGSPPAPKRRRTKNIESSTPPKAARSRRHPSPLPKGTRFQSHPKTILSPPPEDRNKDSSLASAFLALWAEDNDISAKDLAQAYDIPLTATSPPPEAPLRGSKTEIGKYISIDCEMVGVEHGASALARVSIVNYHGHCVLDTFVRPRPGEKVTDWRTWVSGVKPSHMKKAVPFKAAQKQVAKLMEGRILVGHALQNDLEALLVGHPKRDIRDTSQHLPFKKLNNGGTPGLKKLAKEVLGIEIQGGEHSSIEDARACMLLFRRHKQEFERLHALAWPSTEKVRIATTAAKKAAKRRKLAK